MMRCMRRLPFGVVVLVSLAACASVPLAPDAQTTAAWEQRKQDLACLTQWQLRGRMALAADGDGWNASLAWRQDGENYRMHLSGPFGASGLRLTGDEQAFRLEQGGESYTHFGPPEDLVEAEIGVAIPVSGLRYWVLGLPQPEAAKKVALNPDGQLASLEQSGWEIRYNTYRQYDGAMLPRVMVMERPGVRLRLVTTDWTLPQTEYHCGDDN